MKMKKESNKEETEELSFGREKSGWKANVKFSSKNSATWIHRLITVGVICYLVGIKGWL